MKSNIDFVLTWVDGNDPSWLDLKRKFEKSDTIKLSRDPDTHADCRFRDYDTLKYWFRSVERFAPWVNRIFFVTCGQKPEWLDESNPKLRIVNHDEFIPSDYLPTFNSNVIELNLHRIADLSVQFVLFNDDMFLLRPVNPDFYFKNGNPVLVCDIRACRFSTYGWVGRMIANNDGLLKQSINVRVRQLVIKNIWKYVDISKLGLSAVSNLLSLAVNRTVFSGTFGHVPYSHLKSTFVEIWHSAPNIMDEISHNKFREDNDVNHWLACAWNMVSGRFSPAHTKKRGKSLLLLDNNLSRVCSMIRNQSFPQICINESRENVNMDYCLEEIRKAFEALLPDKSSFEK